MSIKHQLNGFTLVELAVVLVIISLLLGGLLLPLSAQVEQKNYSESRQLLNEAKEALLGYAMTHSATDGKPYLPCPDTDNDGKENRDVVTLKCSSSNSTEGALPWSDLGLAATDTWGNRLRYRVLNRFADASMGFSLSTSLSSNTLSICEDATCARTVATGLPAIIVSSGPNGLGATNQSGTLNLAPTSADELTNTDGNELYVMHTLVQNSFDDLLVWLPATTLFNRMVTAGKLP